MTTRLQKFLDLAQKRLKRSVDADAHNRKDGIEDLKFLNGEQWDPQEKQRRARSGRPVLQVNMLTKYVDQVVGDERHNRPRIKVRPSDNHADAQIARIREGIISNIEYLSNADAIYDQAFEQAVSCGYGAWRVLTRYTDENPFIQEIYIERIKNPFLVYLDPDCKDLTGADAKWGFILERMPREEFEERYSKHEVPGTELKVGQGLSQEMYYDKNTVTVAEYFVQETKAVTLCQLADGMVVTEEKAKELLKSWEEKSGGIVDSAERRLALEDNNVVPFPVQPGIAPQTPQVGLPGLPRIPTQPQTPMATMPRLDSGPRPEVVKRRKTDQIIIKHYVITAFDVLNENGLDGEDFPGKYIPIIVVKGKERNIEGKDYVRSLIRDAKDPQRLLNYWHTAAAEVISLQPKSPWLGTPKMFEGFENDYARANTENFPFLMYNIDPDAPQQRPTREGPGDPPIAMFTQIARAEENIKSVLGMYNSDVGGQGSERTGAAVFQKQVPGDIGTFAFSDNLKRSVAHTGRIINEMIPEVYDTERDVRLRLSDDTDTFAPINTTAGAAFKQMTENPLRYDRMSIDKLKNAINVHGRGARFNDISVGKYSVVVTTGPSYATRRQETVEYLLRLTQSLPKQMALAVDILVRNMDFKDAEEVAERLKKTLPQGLARPREGEPPPQPMPPPPQVIMQQKKVELEQKKIDLMVSKIDLEKIKVVNELNQSKGEMKKLVLEILSELHAPNHPADNILRR